MSALHALETCADAAEACERASVALKRATKDVEASVRGFGLEPNAVLRARGLCLEVARLASCLDCALTAAEDAAALEYTADTPGLSKAEDRAATRERLSSAQSEPVRIRLVRYKSSNDAHDQHKSVPFLFHRRSQRVTENDLARDSAMRSLLLEAKEKLEASTNVAGLYSAIGEKITDVHSIVPHETYVAKMASDLTPNKQFKVSEGSVSRLMFVESTRDHSRNAPRFAVVPNTNNASRARPQTANSPRKQSDFFDALARPKPVWVRSFIVKVIAYGMDAGGAVDASPKVLEMRLPENGLGGMSLLFLKKRIALLAGYEQAMDPNALTLRLSPGKTALRHPAELHPGCSLSVLVNGAGGALVGKQLLRVDSKTDGRTKKPTRSSSAPARRSPTLMSSREKPNAAEFAPSSPAGKATRARFEALREDGGFDLRNSLPAKSELKSKSSPRNPYGVGPFSFADGDFAFTPVARSPKPPPRPDRAPMSKLLPTDLRFVIAKPHPRVHQKPNVGEYCFGSRIRFAAEMLPPARKVRAPGDLTKKKRGVKKKTVPKKVENIHLEVEKQQSINLEVEKQQSINLQTDGLPDDDQASCVSWFETPGKRSDLETEKESSPDALLADHQQSHDPATTTQLVHHGAEPDPEFCSRLPAKTPIGWDAGTLGRVVSDELENVNRAKAFFDELAREVKR